MSSPWAAFAGLKFLIDTNAISADKAREVAAEVERWFADVGICLPACEVWRLVSFLLGLSAVPPPPPQAVANRNRHKHLATCFAELCRKLDAELKLLLEPEPEANPNQPIGFWHVVVETQPAPLVDLREALERAKPYIGPPPHQGSQTKYWHTLVTLLSPRIEEALRAGGRKRIGIKPGGPLVAVLFECLCTFLEDEAPEKDTISSFLRRHRKGGVKNRFLTTPANPVP